MTLSLCMATVVPVKDTHVVDLTWELPCLFDQYRLGLENLAENTVNKCDRLCFVNVFHRVKPLHYLGWLLGHEGKGSVLSFLKKRLVS